MSHSFRAKIVGKRQMTIPTKMMKILHLDEGDELEFVVENGEVTVNPLKLVSTSHFTPEVVQELERREARMEAGQEAELDLNILDKGDWPVRPKDAFTFAPDGSYVTFGRYRNRSGAAAAAAGFTGYLRGMHVAVYTLDKGSVVQVVHSGRTASDRAKTLLEKSGARSISTRPWNPAHH